MSAPGHLENPAHSFRSPGVLFSIVFLTVGENMANQGIFGEKRRKNVEKRMPKWQEMKAGFQ